MTVMQELEYAVDPRGVATIRFNRPDKANSYDQAMLDHLGSLLETVRSDPAIRVVVLRGAGRHFSAGAAIGESAAHAPERPRRLIIEVCKLLDDSPKPTIAVVQGACIGGALALACCCDTLIAGHDAAFSIPELRLGFAPGPLLPFFVRAMGHRAVRHYLLSGERFSGADALRLGLAHKLGETAALERMLDDTVEAIVLGAPEAQARAKAVLHADAVTPLSLADLQRLQAAFDASTNSAESVEGRASFAEKRKPRWYPRAT